MEFNHWLWLVLSIILFVIELNAPGISFMWLGAAAALTAVIVWLVPMGWAAQCLLFSILVLISLFAWWKFFRGEDKSDNHLNNPAGRYVGQTHVLVQAIENGRGKIQIGDTQWVVEGDNLPVGSKVKITAVHGMSFKVKAVE
ncbi:MAG TPA: NfeD family protein [Pseudomonadales bacterium]|nr:NfeD family protein [Pseudomonadales bacterium]